MKMEPLNENELEWLDDVLTKYNTDQAILDVAELDGLITAVLSFSASHRAGTVAGRDMGGTRVRTALDI